MQNEQKQTINKSIMKNILIAGAGKGIGLAVATQLTGTANVFTISRNPTEAQIGRAHV